MKILRARLYELEGQDWARRFVDRKIRLNGNRSERIRTLIFLKEE